MQSTGHTGGRHLPQPEHSSGTMMTSMPCLTIAPNCSGQWRHARAPAAGVGPHTLVTRVAHRREPALGRALGALAAGVELVDSGGECDDHKDTEHGADHERAREGVVVDDVMSSSSMPPVSRTWRHT